MIRRFNVPAVFPALLLALPSLAFAQVAPPAAAPGRGNLVPVVTGPPAPVPPEVAIPRPTADELTQVNSAVTKWIAADQSSTKPLLQKYGSLLMLQPPRLNVAAT